MSNWTGSRKTRFGLLAAAALLASVVVAAVGHDISAQNSGGSAGTAAIRCAWVIQDENSERIVSFTELVTSCVQQGPDHDVGLRAIDCAAELDYITEGRTSRKTLLARCGI